MLREMVAQRWSPPQTNLISAAELESLEQ